MTDRNITNTAASVRQKLLNLSRERSEDFGYLLSRYGTERLLFRISQSQYVDKFILKGAVLFQLWSEQPHRPTRDVDLLGYGESSPERISVILTELCELEVEDDGLVFDTSSITAEAIKEDAEYEGIRAKLRAHLDKHGFNDITITSERDMMPATRLDPDHPWAKWAIKSLSKTAEDEIAVIPNLGGALPNDVFADLLGLPTIWVPHSND